MLLIVAACILGALIATYSWFVFMMWHRRNRFAFPAAGVTMEAPGPEFVREDLQLPVERGIGGADSGTVHAWWIGAAQPAATMIFFHGNGYPLENEVKSEAPALKRIGANLLLTDYRGYGLSSPLKPSAASAAADARAGVRHLTEDRGIPLEQIWICGRSIGSVVAVRLAIEFPNCAGLILLSPITNTLDVKPFRKFTWPLRWLGLAKDFDSRKRIKGLTMPLLIVTGTEDVIATPSMASILHGRAVGPKRLELLEGTTHTIWRRPQDCERIPALIAEFVHTRGMPIAADIDA